MEETVTSVVSGMSETQIQEASTALTTAVNTVLDTFVDMLPIIALTIGAIFGIRFVKGQFNRIGRAR